MTFCAGKDILRVARLCVSAVALFATFPASAQADEDEAAETEIRITPYVWASGYGGTITPGVGAPTFRVEKSFGELLEDLNGAFFISGSIRHRRVVAITDFSHTSSSKEGLVPTGNPALPFLPAEGRLRQTSFTAVAGYRAVDDENLSLDILAGGRAWWVRPKVTVPALAITRSAKADFIDPIVATRVNVKLSPTWSAMLYGDIGGFGASSDLTFQGLATVNAKVGKRIWVSAGYRYLAVDYDHAGVRINNRLGGPLLGATIGF